VKASLLTLALFALSVPALADESQFQAQELVPGTAGIMVPDLRQTGRAEWSEVDRKAAPEDEDLSPLAQKLTRSLVFSGDTPEAEVKAKLQAVAAQLIEEARRDESIQSMHFRLRLRCVTEKRAVDPQQDTSRPLLWASMDPGEKKVERRACAVKLQKAVKLRDGTADPGAKPRAAPFAPAVLRDH
jgi:hypothetical protein